MKAYESGSAAYFATPPVNLIYAFHASLSKITKSSPSLTERYELHREASRRIKTAATELGLKQLPLDPAFSANGMTAVHTLLSLSRMNILLMKGSKLYYPEGLGAGDILPRLVKKGVVVAGGLHANIKGLWYHFIHDLLY